MADRLDLPYFPLWVDDWLASPSVNAMTPEQEGAFIRLLMLAWRSDPPCTLPDDDRVLAGMSRLGSRWKKVGGLVRQQFVPVEGRLRNAKLFAVYGESVARHESAVQRGKLGGRPAKAEVNPQDKPKDKLEETSALAEVKLSLSPTKPIKSTEGERAQDQEPSAVADRPRRKKASPSPALVSPAVDPPENGGRPHPTWLQVVAAEWDEKNGAGTFPYGIGGKALKPLTAHHTPEKIAQNLWVYLTMTEPRFVNLHKFAQTFAQWDYKDPVVDGVMTPFGERMLGGAR